MDAKFHPAITAIKSGDVDRLRALIRADAALATSVRVRPATAPVKLHEPYVETN